MSIVSRIFNETIASNFFKVLTNIQRNVLRTNTHHTGTTFVYLSKIHPLW